MRNDCFYSWLNKAMLTEDPKRICWAMATAHAMSHNDGTTMVSMSTYLTQVKGLLAETDADWGELMARAEKAIETMDDFWRDIFGEGFPT